MSEVELQPDTGEILQEEPAHITAIPVCVEDVRAPVRVQILPRKGPSTMTKPLTTNPSQILRADHWRGRALLMCTTDFLVAFSEASCQADTSMALWPAHVPLELTAAAEVWAKVPTSTGSLSVVTERWADGK